MGGDRPSPHRGDAGTARRLSLLPRSGAGMRNTALVSRVRHRRRRNGRAAHQPGRQRGRDCGTRARHRSRRRTWSYIPSYAPFDLIEAYVRAGRVAAATQAANRVAPHVHQAWARAALAALFGLVGHEEEFDARFAESIALLEELRTPYEEARSRLSYGERLRRTGRRIEARQQLRAALTIFERLGAEPSAGRARSELRTSGETLRARHDASGIDQLTPRNSRWR